jgi:DegV family protein with EDD domain
VTGPDGPGPPAAPGGPGGARVAVVTDSTSSLPASVVEETGIHVVSLHVVLGDRVLDERTEATPETVATALREWRPVSTSRPAPEIFLDAYRAAAAAGATGVVSLHLSAEMSGTYDSALRAAADAPVEVRVVDTRSVGMGLGFAAMAAAEAAARGGDVDGVVEAARRRLAGTTAYFYVDTLEYLRRGGRIGAAQALVGSVLAVKPLLHVADGRIQPLEKVRTAARAVARLEEIAVARAEQAGERPVDIAVQHLANPERAEQLASHLRARVPRLNHLYVTEIGPVIGVHVGPGTLAVVISA